MTTANANTSSTAKPNYSRATLRTEGRKKRKLKLKTDKDFAKTYFEAKSKRSVEKKSAFRKKKTKKK